MMIKKRKKKIVNLVCQINKLYNNYLINYEIFKCNKTKTSSERTKK